MKSIKFIENTSEIGAGTRGASLGIDALKLASLNLNLKNFKKFDFERISDENRLLFIENTTDHAIRIEGIVKVYDRIAEATRACLERNEFPLILAADHASAGGTIAGLKAAFPNKRLGVIWIDAHADLHSPYTTPSGNVHGMPLATALGEDNLDCKINTLDSKTADFWECLKNTSIKGSKIDSSDLVFYGVRDTEEPEEYLLNKYGIPNFTVEDCRQKGMAQVAAEGVQHLEKCDLIYISFDVDSMDPDIASYGTGTPVENGFRPDEAQALIENLIKTSKKLVAFEMVEINPLLDKKGNKMARTAATILDNLLPIIENHAI